ncbi:unnamed protein product [Arabidopsis thaliana]|uniref:Uncharacterized protein n=1 Tax=Arabidopsis thaliana TaxID=3702 RepID=A0A654FD17_ARATH|nr:unnamed protein product [Arabidopsis thaliana]
MTISRIIDTQIAIPIETGEENAKDGDVDCQIIATTKKADRKSETSNSASSNGKKDKRPRLDN